MLDQRVESLSPSLHEFSVSGTGAPCKGDSGGPVFVRRDGALFLAGIASTSNDPRLTVAGGRSSWSHWWANVLALASKLDFTSSGVTTVRTAAGATVDVFPEQPLEAKLDPTFSGSSSFYLRSTELSVTEMPRVVELDDDWDDEPEDDPKDAFDMDSDGE